MAKFVQDIRRIKMFLKKMLFYIACYFPVPNRYRICLYRLAGVRFQNPHKVFIGYNVFIDIWSDTTSVFIGEHCIIASGVRILTHYLDGSAVPHSFYEGSVHIGDRVFIGMNAVIAKPAVIGSGAVIAANSLVTRDILPYTIVMGVPAEVVGSRKKKPGIK